LTVLEKSPGQILKIIQVITLDAQVDMSGTIQAVEVPTTDNPVTYTVHRGSSRPVFYIY